MCANSGHPVPYTFSPSERLQLAPQVRVEWSSLKMLDFLCIAVTINDKVITTVAKDEYGILCRDLFSLEMGMEDAGACQW